ncbi:MAG: type II toxin-antitoxin system VapC family toxin [Mariprofundus sp.]|nr:type II toxin-antitoxin system VapC family toxin [Mariprofundus sp.]
MKALFDTNILIDYLNGIEAAKTELALYESPAISSITWIEVMVGARSEDEEVRLRAFLNRFRIVPVSGEVAERAVELRRQYRMRLPDAMIWASALCESCLLISRNTRDFPPDHPGVRVPYTV